VREHSDALVLFGATGDLAKRSLYPALHRLENKGFLAADWRDSETGREAKYYSLTKQGAKQLEVEDENWQRLSAAVKLVMKVAR